MQHRFSSGRNGRSLAAQADVPSAAKRFTLVPKLLLGHVQDVKLCFTLQTRRSFV